MKKKYAFEVAEELAALDRHLMEHYYLEGDCPEIMSVTRLIDYALGIAENNKEDEEFPNSLKDTKYLSFKKAVEIIEWFGESVYLIDFNEPPQSIKFIKED
jgi:glutathione S-transferase